MTEVASMGLLRLCLEDLDGVRALSVCFLRFGCSATRRHLLCCSLLCLP